MAETKLQVGDDVYVRNPQGTAPGCKSITGPITAIDGDTCAIDAYIVLGAYAGGFEKREITLPLSGVGRRLGTPISALSGRPGQAGFEEFSRIARSWGYP